MNKTRFDRFLQRCILKTMPKKKDTIESLAQLSQKEFTAVREEMRKGFEQTSTKEDLRQTEKRLARAIEGLELHISSYASSWSRDFERLHEWVKNHEERMEYIEKKVGLRR